MKLLHENEIDNDSTVCGTLRPRCFCCSLGAPIPTTGDRRNRWCRQVAISTVVEVYGMALKSIRGMSSCHDVMFVGGIVDLVGLRNVIDIDIIGEYM